MSVLESTEEEGIQLQAVCQLLSLGIRHTPRPVLISKFSICSKLLMARLEAVMATGTVQLIKSVSRHHRQHCRTSLTLKLAII